MTNSTQSLLKFIDNLQLASLYVEDNFPLPVESTFRMPPADAVKYLIGSATVGSKVAGFFYKVPPFVTDRPLRASCIFISRELPSEIATPVFFCKKPRQLSDIMPRAVKVSADTGMPVQVVLSANVLNNYSDKDIPQDTQDRVLPYISASGVPAPWDPAQRREKLFNAYSSTVSVLPYVKPESNGISLELPDEYFPEYVFPLVTAEQVSLFEGMASVNTTPAEQIFVSAWVKDVLGLNIEVTASLAPSKPLSMTKLCPGCPFMAIFSTKDISDHVVFTSVNCPAIREIYPVTNMDYAEYLGMISHKTNASTLFIGTMSDTSPVNETDFTHGKVIILQDNNVKSPLPPIGTLAKLKNIKNMTLPYSCKNIKHSSVVKYNRKRCNCFEHRVPPVCMKETHCSALQHTSIPAEANPDKLYIDKNLCTGCRICVRHCPVKALS